MLVPHEQREQFLTNCVTEATVEGSLHLHAILTCIVERIQAIQKTLVECEASRITPADRGQARQLVDVMIESMESELPVDIDSLLATVDPDDHLMEQYGHAEKCVRNAMNVLIKGMYSE